MQRQCRVLLRHSVLLLLLLSIIFCSTQTHTPCIQCIASVHYIKVIYSCKCKINKYTVRKKTETKHLTVMRGVMEKTAGKQTSFKAVPKDCPRVEAEVTSGAERVDTSKTAV